MIDNRRTGNSLRGVSGACALLLVLFTVVVATRAGAHPMGNFAVCHFSAVRAFPDEVRIHYIIDIAEVPTFHELKKLDTNGDKKYTDEEIAAYRDKIDDLLASGLQLEIDGVQQPLKIRKSLLEIRDGLPGLKVMWIELQLSAAVPARQWPKRTVEYVDNNFPDIMGWKEIRVYGSPETVIIDTSDLSPKKSNALTEYPESLTSDPPLDLKVTFTFGPGESDKLYALDSGKVNEKSKTVMGFAARVKKIFDIYPYLKKESLSTHAVVVGLIFAFVLGCFHALSPGHGKTLVAAYLVGTRGKPTDALTLGLIVTFTHVAAVLAIFAVLLSFWARLNTEHLYGWLGVSSGIIIALMGVWIIMRNYRGRYIPHVHDEFGRHVSPEELKKRPELLEYAHGHTHDGHAHHHGEYTHTHDGHSHDHNLDVAHTPSHDHAHEHTHARDHAHDVHQHVHCAHDHTHPHSHDHSGEPAAGDVSEAAAADKKGVHLIDLLTLGITGGIVPCPTAIIILFASIGLNRLGFGLMLMVSFSVGLAFVLILIGLTIIYTRNIAVSRFQIETAKFIHIFPYISGVIVALIGLGIFANGLRAVGFL